jgi:hypothetical protein
MAHTTPMLIFLYVLLCHLITWINGTGLDTEQNPYSFHLFENFEVTKIVYEEEANLVKIIQEIKEKLLQRKSHIEKYLQSERTQNDLHSLKDGLRIMTPLKNYLPALNKTTSEFPRMNDMDGAVNGMIQLQFAYHLNLTALSEHGLVEYLNSHGSTIQFNSFER